MDTGTSLATHPREEMTWRFGTAGADASACKDFTLVSAVSARHVEHGRSPIGAQSLPSNPEPGDPQ
jgi:hypothetical protein